MVDGGKRSPLLTLGRSHLVERVPTTLTTPVLGSEDYGSQHRPRSVFGGLGYVWGRVKNHVEGSRVPLVFASGRSLCLGDGLLVLILLPDVRLHYFVPKFLSGYTEKVWIRDSAVNGRLLGVALLSGVSQFRGHWDPASLE